MKKKTFAVFFGAIMLISIFNIGIITGQKTKPVTINNYLTNKLEDFENHYAVVVGISDYKGDLNDLGCPASEAEKMATLLVNKGWNENNVQLLKNKEASRDNITGKLNWLSEKEGTVLFYYAGHGTQVKDEDGDENENIIPRDEAIVPWEATRESLITDDELKTIMDGFNADKSVCIFVTCFAGGLIEDDTSKNVPKTINLFRKMINYFSIIGNILARPLIRKTLMKSFSYNEKDFDLYQPLDELQAPNRLIMTSCQENRQTYEFPIINQPFSVMVRNGLKGGILDGVKVDKNNDGYISAEETFNYVQPRATLEAATALGAPFAIVSVIKQWIKGDASLIEVLYICGIYGLIIPVPQIYDSDTNQEILLT